jgi:hypothetical protein
MLLQFGALDSDAWHASSLYANVAVLKLGLELLLPTDIHLGGPAVETSGLCLQLHFVRRKKEQGYWTRIVCGVDSYDIAP